MIRALLLFYFLVLSYVTLSWWRSLSCRNQSIDLQSKSIDWFLYYRDLRHERVTYSVETRYSLRIIPRYFTFFDIVASCPLIRKCKCLLIVFFLGRKRIIAALLVFRLIFFLFATISKSFKAKSLFTNLLIFLMIYLYREDLCHHQNDRLLLLTELRKSFMKIKNRNL